MRDIKPRRPGWFGPWHLLVLQLICLAALASTYRPELGRYTPDGNYYYDIAQNIAEERGFVTRISLYNQGFVDLPHRATAYPLWPLTLGMLGRAIPLDLLRSLLPRAFYLLSLVLLYLLANRLAESMSSGGSDRGARGPGGVWKWGHSAVVVLGLNPVFFRFTAVPYTEGMALTLLFGALLAVAAAVNGRWYWAAASGGLAGLAYLTRFPLAGAIGAIPIAFLIGSLRDRRLARHAPAALAGGLFVVGLYVTWLLSWVDRFDAQMLLEFQAYRETSALMPFRFRVETLSAFDHLLDRGRGVLVAFSPAHRFSYAASFGYLIYAVPAALAWMLYQRCRGSATNEVGEYVLPLSVVFTSVAVLVPVHEAHHVHSFEWLFNHRQGLPMVLLVIPGMIVLGQQSRFMNRVIHSLMIASASFGVLRILWVIGERSDAGFTVSEYALAKWLDSLPAGTSVVTSRPQALSVLTDVGLHWTACQEPPGQTRILVETVGADHVVVYPEDMGCRFLADADREFEVVQRFDDRAGPIKVLRRRAGAIVKRVQGQE